MHNGRRIVFHCAFFCLFKMWKNLAPKERPGSSFGYRVI